MVTTSDTAGDRNALIQHLQEALGALESGDEAGWRREIDALAALRTQPMMAGLGRLAREVDGVSVDARLLFAQDAAGRVTGTTDLVDRAHDVGLEVYTWTLRPENRFLPKSLRIGTEPGDWGRWDDAFSLILSTGVDGVFADHPDLVLSLLDAS